MARMKLMAVIPVLSGLIRCCRGDGFMDMLSPFFDLEELAEQVAKDAPHGATAEPVDRTFPLAAEEMDVLMQFYRECRTQESTAMRTWCTGDEDCYFDELSNNSCPPGVRTHPCTGRVLHDNRTFDEEFLWSWEGLRCDAYTDPTTVTHIYLPGQSFSCELDKVDLSVMVSLEQLDLSNNELYGEFPDWLGEMTTLRLLNLENNQLSGDIPASFAGNDALELINLSSNNLTAVTLSFFDAFNRLQHINLSYNKFALELSKHVLASEFLRTINLSHNGFRGELPQLPTYPFLEAFDVSSNFLTGEIPTNLTLWGREDPHDPDEKPVLAIVDMSSNLFTGDLPAIYNQSALHRLDVRNNKGLNGLLPEFPSSLLLNPADFDGNAFGCPIPPVLLPSDLTCVCGNGYSIISNETTDEGGVSVQVIRADQASVVCQPCREGFYSNATTNQECLACPAGTSPDAVAGGKADHCKFCLPGTFSNESASSSCRPCPPGTFTSSIGATSCDPCYPGEYAANQGSTNCSVCAVGTFSNFSGATVCTPCEVGTCVNTEGEAECLLCPKDTYQDVVGSMECKTCPVGYIAPQLGHVKCLPCSPGSYFDVKTKTCTLCSPRTFTKEAAQTKCSKCKNGTVAEGFGNLECVQVAAIGSGYRGNMTVLECDAGTFNDGTWRTCQPCASGTFASNRGSRICSPCAKGSFALRKGSLSCEKAVPGSFVGSGGAVQAGLCPSNSVSTTSGSTSCTPCDEPYFSFLPGGINCSLAEPGEVYKHVEWPQLTLDLAGVSHYDLLTPSIDELLQAWTDALSSYSGSSPVLHLLQVNQLLASSHGTRIVVAVESTTHSKKTRTDDDLSKGIGDAIHQATKAAESALGDLLNELQGSNSGSGNDSEKLRDLVVSSSFQDALVRQFNHAKLFNGALSFRLVNVSMVESQFKSTRAVPCDPGTFLSLKGDERSCLPCPIGSFSSTSGALTCERCPRGTFSAVEGLEGCQPCPSGADSAPGASSCVECSWYTYECDGFWQDVIASVCVGAALFRMIFKKIRRLCVGDQAVQEQDASVALMAAVRTHGRTFDGVRHASMGIVSADTMFGSDEDKR